eukprot:365928-Chlamydomonas_euryale.AAC.7
MLDICVRVRTRSLMRRVWLSPVRSNDLSIRARWMALASAPALAGGTRGCRSLNSEPKDHRLLPATCEGHAMQAACHASNLPCHASNLPCHASNARLQPLSPTLDPGPCLPPPPFPKVRWGPSPGSNRVTQPQPGDDDFLPPPNYYVVNTLKTECIGQYLPGPLPNRAGWLQMSSHLRSKSISTFQLRTFPYDSHKLRVVVRIPDPELQGVSSIKAVQESKPTPRAPDLGLQVRAHVHVWARLHVHVWAGMCGRGCTCMCGRGAGACVRARAQVGCACGGACVGGARVRVRVRMWGRLRGRGACVRARAQVGCAYGGALAWTGEHACAGAGAGAGGVHVHMRVRVHGCGSCARARVRMLGCVCAGVIAVRVRVPSAHVRVRVRLRLQVRVRARVQVHAAWCSASAAACAYLPESPAPTLPTPTLPTPDPAYSPSLHPCRTGWYSASAATCERSRLAISGSFAATLLSTSTHRLSCPARRPL